MALTVKPAAGTYSLNTGSAYAPDHLWMCDEGSGTSLTDRGSATAMSMTLQNADMLGTDGTLGAIITCVAATSRYALGATGSMFADTGCLIVVAKSTANANADANEYVFSAANSANNNARCGAAAVNGAQTAQVFNLDDVPTTAVQIGSGTFYDSAWHMLAIKVKTGTAVSTCAISVDGGAWSDDDAATIGTRTLTRYGLGVRASSTLTQIFDGSIAAAWAYHEPTYASLDDAWISTLYNSGDPWSKFLNTSTIQAFQYQSRLNPLLRM